MDTTFEKLSKKLDRCLQVQDDNSVELLYLVLSVFVPSVSSDHLTEHEKYKIFKQVENNLQSRLVGKRS